MAFCYYVMLPRAIDFLINFASDVFDSQLRASEYLTFVTTFKGIPEQLKVVDPARSARFLTLS